MSSVIFGCTICGFAVNGSVITRDNYKWVGEFRAVYTSPEGYFITGVGLHFHADSDIWSAPSQPTMSWNHPDYHFPLSDTIPVMSQCPENGRHGYIFHDCCWQLLEKAFEPVQVPLERLYAICHSLPYPLKGIGISWGHDYGGLFSLDETYHFPWEDRLTDRHGRRAIARRAKANPYDVPRVSKLISMCSEIQSSSGLQIQSSAPHRQGEDCFSAIPWELLETIAMNLTTKDAFNLLTISRRFLSLLTSQTYWASKFEPGWERDHVFETRCAKRPIDWIALYRHTNNANSPRGLKNRRRIWTLIQEIIGVLCIEIDNSLETPYGLERRSWNQVAGDIKELPNPSVGPQFNGPQFNLIQLIGPNFYALPFNIPQFNDGCRLCKTQQLILPNNLATIGISIARFGSVDFVTGMRFMCKNGSSICLGYVSRSCELTLNINAVEGFILAVGSRGIHALQVVDGQGCTSRWFGNPRDSPVTYRLKGLRTISALKGGFDGFKMVSLAVAQQDALFTLQSTTPDLPLREAAIWYPTVPSNDLFLNAATFTGESPLTSGYQPLMWVRFGGPNGSYLRFLKEVRLVSLGYLCRIEFHYNAADVPMEKLYLGRRKRTKVSRVQRLSIDGLGGEKIRTVEVSVERLIAEGVYRFHQYGKLHALKFITNRGRSIEYEHSGVKYDVSALKPLSLESDSTITGLYGSQVSKFYQQQRPCKRLNETKHPEEGLISMGLISEQI